MQLKTWLDEERGRRTRLAEFLTAENPARPVDGAFITAMSAPPGLPGARPVPSRLAHGIEKFSGGAVMRWDCCPNDWWELWPELRVHRDAPPFSAQSRTETAPASTTAG